MIYSSHQCEREGTAAWREALALLDAWDASRLPVDGDFLVESAEALVARAADSRLSGAAEAAAARGWQSTTARRAVGSVQDSAEMGTAEGTSA